MNISCKDLQMGSLRNNSISEAELISKIKECPQEICGSIYGPGSNDLTSVGALISVAVQLMLAFSYWLTILLFKAGIIPLLQGRRSWQRLPILQSKGLKTQYAFITWLSQDHGSSLWHQLYFTLALSIACLIRQTNRTSGVTGVFESSSIISFLAISFISLHITTISYYGVLKREWLFIFGYIVTLSCGTIAVLCPIWLTEVENLLSACVEYAAETSAPWRYGAMGPFDPSVIIKEVLTITLFLVSLFFWLWLRRLETKELRESSEAHDSDITERYYNILAIITDITERSHPGLLLHSKKTILSRNSRFLYVLIILMSGFHMCTAIDSFRELIVTRQAMNVVLANRTEQNIWGIGQIAAPFVWVPLLVEMMYSALERISAQNSQGTSR